MTHPEFTTQQRTRFWEKVDRSGDCWLWLGHLDRRGYGMQHCGDSRTGIYRMHAHRAAWILTRGPIAHDTFVCHRCDNPTCVRPDHLFLGTHDENMRDMAQKGRAARTATTHPESRPRGEIHYKAQVTERQVRQIRALFASGQHRQVDLAEQFAVSKTVIQGIVRRRTWRHLD